MRHVQARGAQPDRDHGAARRGRSPATAGGPARPGAAPDRAHPAAAPAVRPSAPRRSPWWARGTAIAAAACLVATIVFGAFAFRAQQRADQLEARQQRIESVLTAPDVRMASTEQTGYGTGTVASSRERDLVLFTLRDGRQLPTAKTYQLWFI
ncbi:MAG: hypothetical protein GEV00_22085, partial [Actinophytocola sp.]|nr:hypothetical protein [Actinophytocola sp.]